MTKDWQLVSPRILTPDSCILCITAHTYTIPEWMADFKHYFRPLPRNPTTTEVANWSHFVIIGLHCR